MKKLLLLAVLCIPTAAYCDIQSSITSSVKLESLSAASTADKLGSSYSISGTNITTVDSNLLLPNLINKPIRNLDIICLFFQT